MKEAAQTCNFSLPGQGFIAAMELLTTLKPLLWGLTMILLQALLALTTQFTFAHADDVSRAKTMADFAGHYTVKDCSFTENYISLPKDYYCRATEIDVTTKGKGLYEITFVDELSQHETDIAMSDFRQEEKDGTVLQGAFTNGDSSSQYMMSRQSPNGAYYSETRSFSIEPQGAITYNRATSASNNESYKNAEWIYQLTKTKDVSN